MKYYKDPYFLNNHGWFNGIRQGPSPVSGPTEVIWPSFVCWVTAWKRNIVPLNGWGSERKSLWEGMGEMGRSTSSFDGSFVGIMHTEFQENFFLRTPMGWFLQTSSECQHNLISDEGHQSEIDSWSEVDGFFEAKNPGNAGLNQLRGQPFVWNGIKISCYSSRGKKCKYYWPSCFSPICHQVWCCSQNLKTGKVKILATIATNWAYVSHP